MFQVDHLQEVLVNASELNTQQIIPLFCFSEKTFPDWLALQNEQVKAWLESHDFKAKEGQVVYVPNQKGELDFVIAGLDKQANAHSIAPIAIKLNPGYYQIQNDDADWLYRACMAWGKAGYRFAKFDASKRQRAKLIWPDVVDKEKIQKLLNAIYWIRDMENNPTETFSVPDLVGQVERLAESFGAAFTSYQGDELLEENYPLVHAVGRAGAHVPGYATLTWGDAANPLLCLVGKGVCYDTGGLSIKPTRGMLLMKKDMGGAAHALGLAYLIMAFDLPVRLKLFIPAVENAVSGNSYRPGDVFIARNGLSVEITNTDAEGRLVMADALAEATENDPNLIIDFATLTGAARVALGPDIAAAMSQPAAIGEALQAMAPAHDDPVATLPLYQSYKKFLKSEIAQTTNASSQPYGGAITAGLFLQQFVGEHEWLHMDIPAWNTDATAGGPGAEAMGLLTVWAWLNNRYGQS